MNNEFLIKSAMESLLNTQAQVNGILEMTPKSDQKQQKLSLRNTSRKYYAANVQPLWLKLQALNDGAGGFLKNTLIQNLYPRIKQSMILENGVLSRLSGSTQLMGAFGDEAQDIQTGMNAAQYFYNEATAFTDTGLPDTWDDFVSYINQKSPAFFSGLGFAINSIGLTDDQVQTTMKQMADNGNGRIPILADSRENWTAFFSAIGRANDPSFWQSLKYAVKQTAVDVGGGIKQTGENLITGLSSTSSLLKYLPYIALGLGGLYLFTLAGGPLQVMRSKK